MSVEVHMAKSGDDVVLNRNPDPVQFPDPKIFLENNDSEMAEDGATIDTTSTVTTISGKKVSKKKPLVNISNLDTTINVPL